jgi:hypothetical protein
MTARDRVLRAYGGAGAWCACPGPLEMDHGFGDGAAPRRALAGTAIDVLLCREYRRTGHWPPRRVFRD